MDFDERCTIENDIILRVWLSRYRECRNTRLPEWVSLQHPKKLPCRVVGESSLSDQHGSFNLTCKVVLDDGEACAVRFPMIGRVKYPDEKLAREVEVMNLVYNRTSVPIPRVIAWGSAADNSLGLGPFLITSFMEGVSLGDILSNHQCDNSRMMREDISDDDIEKIYRQIAHIQLQLSKLDFDRIGSPCLSSHEGNGQGPISVRARPFTFKSHEILNVGGIDVFGEPGRTFSSTTEYFSFVIEQDVQQLTRQLNSVDDEEDAASKYKAWKAIRRVLLPRLASSFSHHEPFKLICDDFGPANMIVNNAEDLQIVGVIDWEWTYAGPRELLWSAPRWLLIQSPSMWEDSSVLVRYNKYLDIYIRQLKDQEEQVLGPSYMADRSPSDYLKRSKDDGSAWFYQMMRDAFNGPTNVPFQQLCLHMPELAQLIEETALEEVKSFVQLKLRHRKLYDDLLQGKREWLQRILDGYESVPDLDQILGEGGQQD